MYSDKVKDHFKNPRNVGKIENSNGMGEVGNPICGDMMTITIEVENERIKDIKFLTFGCGAAIAVSSMLTEMAMGLSIADAKKVTNKDVAEALDGLPKNKLHCSNLGADALQLAIKNYEDRKAGKLVERATDDDDARERTRGGKCQCPYCEADLGERMDFCSCCGQEVEAEH